MPKLQKINFFLMSPAGKRISFLEPPLDADNFWPYCPRPCGPFRLLKSSIWSKWFSQKNNFGTFRHFGFPRGEIFLDRSKDRWPLMIFIKVHFAATGFPSWWKWPLIRSLINQRWKRWKKPKKRKKTLQNEFSWKNVSRKKFLNFWDKATCKVSDKSYGWISRSVKILRNPEGRNW